MESGFVMESGGARKRGNPDSAAAFNGNGGFKKSKQEMDPLSPGIGSKSKPCTKFYSTSGCSFGESCHFSHFVPGFKASSHMNASHPPASRNQGGAPSFQNGAAPPVKSRLCSKFNSAEGCRFGDNCRFAHGEWELGRPALPPYEDPRSMGPMPGRYVGGGGGRFERSPAALGGGSSFGASATAKISVDASLSGAIIGKGGSNIKQLSRVTGAKLAIREHESDPNLKNIELEGTFDQIKEASAMVHELIMSIRSGGPPQTKRNPAASSASGGASNFKTKLCENFAKGTCTFGEKCHFAHGADQLRVSGSS